MNDYIPIKQAMEQLPKRETSGITISALNTALKRGDLPYRFSSMGERARRLVRVEDLRVYLKKLNSK